MLGALVAVGISLFLAILGHWHLGFALGVIAGALLITKAAWSPRAMAAGQTVQAWWVAQQHPALIEVKAVEMKAVAEAPPSPELPLPPLPERERE